jgi:hypothetical protein
MCIQLITQVHAHAILSKIVFAFNYLIFPNILCNLHKWPAAYQFLAQKGRLVLPIQMAYWVGSKVFQQTGKNNSGPTSTQTLRLQNSRKLLRFDQQIINPSALNYRVFDFPCNVYNQMVCLTIIILISDKGQSYNSRRKAKLSSTALLI